MGLMSSSYESIMQQYNVHNESIKKKISQSAKWSID